MPTRTDTIFDRLDREREQLLARGDLAVALERWRTRDE